ncbi:14395_t:CDS:2, partial [Funneliformis geosporum]
MKQKINLDLHSGNILFDKYNGWNISDFGFCGPANKPLGCIYGNLPYVAPEVIPWYAYVEISSGRPPFAHFDHDYDLAMNIIKGMRPPIVPGTPTEYKNIMVQCWDADPLKRPEIFTLTNKIFEIKKSYYQNENKEQNTNFN